MSLLLGYYNNSISLISRPGAFFAKIAEAPDWKVPVIGYFFTVSVLLSFLSIKYLYVFTESNIPIVNSILLVTIIILATIITGFLLLNSYTFFVYLLAVFFSSDPKPYTYLLAVSAWASVPAFIKLFLVLIFGGSQNGSLNQLAAVNLDIFTVWQSILLTIGVMKVFRLSIFKSFIVGFIPVGAAISLQLMVNEIVGKLKI